MNLEESSSFLQEEEKKNKKKKIVIIFIALCFILILVMFGLIGVIQYQDSQTLKMFIDGTQVNISSTLYKQIDDVTYVNVREIGEMLGYHYTQGEYNQYNEDETSCYLTDDYEVVAFTAEEDSFVKYAEAASDTENVIAEIPVTIKSENGQSQKYKLNNEIQLIDGSIYAPFEALTDMFNVQLNLSQAKRIRIYSLEQVVNNTKNAIGQLGYTNMSGDYENLKAMLYGLAVVGDGTKFGVISLTDGTEVIGVKYEDITFIPNLQDFLIKTSDAVGIFSSEGTAVIKATEYDEISVYDDDKQLYLVKKDNKYGILNRLGETIIYPDYDEIGYSFSNNKNAAQEYKIIFDKCIPVKEGTKYGLYSIEGKELLSCSYDELGSEFSIDTSSATNEKPILEIPPELGIRGIIINKDGGYGVYDITSETIIIPCVCTKAYSITKDGKTTYYIEHNQTQINLDEYLEVQNLKNITTETTTEENVSENATNTVETSTDEVTNEPENVATEQQ